MPKYAVMLEGKNFPVIVEGHTELWGFYTTRKVKANDPQEAEHLAVELIKNDSSLTDMLDQTHNVEPMIFLDSIYHLSWWKRLGGKGYSFFNMEE